MTWLVYRLADRNGYRYTGIEHHAMLPADATVISRHASYPEATAALVRYRDQMEREAMRERGQGELF